LPTSIPQGEVIIVSDAAGRSPPSVSDLEPGSTFGGYRIVRLLDRGGMGVVYEAVEIELDRTVALKLVAPEHTRDPTAVARFKSEARLAASLEHPNIVPIHRGGEHDGVLYLAMRYVAGTNLRKAIDHGPMDPLRVSRIVTEVADALDAAHARGLVHRDVKPANILLTGSGANEHAYLTDFGLTKRLGSVGDLTRTGGWVGTPDYVAPEQIQGRGVDGRADVYSLGCVLYEMLTGHVAYPKDSDMAKLWAHVTDPPPLPRSRRPDLVDAFDVAVACATAKDPDDRYRSGGELAAAVREAVGEQEAKRRADASQETNGGDGAPFAAGRAAAAPPPAEPAGAPAEPPITAGPAPAPAGSGGAGAFDGERQPRGSDGGASRRGRAMVIAGIALVTGAAVAAAIVLVSSSSSSDSGTSRTTAPVGRRIAGNLGPVPTNHVTGAGDAELRLRGDVATVTVDASGLLDGARHPLHIHAGAKGVCPSEQAAHLHNGHRTISTLNGVPWYGSPVTALTSRGDTSPDSILALRRYPATGAIRYTRTIRLGKVVAQYVRDDNAVVVVHGVDYNHNGTYDDVLDRSDLKRSLPGELTTPALCGALVAERSAPGSASKTAMAPAVYRAALTAPPGAPVWECRLRPPTEAARAAT
jgi:predicted Ser/Thr protein kinase